ncbi:MAG: serine hydrolase domain-containing protein [Fulvivirga sp.]|uniref:serine hydrolase domain-containing protein n=1 Tax=Fulvivirga sp. TaxID=1931237 RepID=UPI0032ED1D04
MRLNQILLIFLISISTHCYSIEGHGLTSNLDSVVYKTMADWKIKGLAVCIVREGKILYKKGFGFSDKKSNNKVSDSTLFMIGSATKPLMVLGVLKLVTEGKLSLDSPIQQYLPNFQLFDSIASRKINLRSILSHKTGLPGHDALWFTTTDTREQLVNKLRYLEPNIPYSSAFQYQNMMYMLAGYLCGEITDQTWEEFFKNEVLVPLNMPSTYTSSNEIDNKELYSLGFMNDNPVPNHLIQAIAPAGGVITSIHDLSKFLEFILDEGKRVQLINEELFQESIRKQISVPEGWNSIMMLENQSKPLSYGFGWFISEYLNKKIVLHGGNIRGFTSLISMIPDDGIGIAIISNQDNCRALPIIRNYILDHLLENENKKDWDGIIKTSLSRPSTKTANNTKNGTEKQQVIFSEPTLYAGSFVNKAYGTIEIIVREKDSFEINFNGSSGFDLQPLSKENFMVKYPGRNFPITFHFNTENRIDYISAPFEPMLPKGIIFKKTND